MQARPEKWGSYVTEGTWDEQIVEEIAPQPGDIVVRKQRYSGFAGTNLDMILKTHGIRYCLYTGVATNVCVETTLRDGYLLDYWPVMVTDACNNSGPEYNRLATEWNVEHAFGWIATTSDVIDSRKRGIGASDDRHHQAAVRGRLRQVRRGRLQHQQHGADPGPVPGQPGLAGPVHHPDLQGRPLLRRQAHARSHDQGGRRDLPRGHLRRPSGPRRPGHGSRLHRERLLLLGDDRRLQPAAGGEHPHHPAGGRRGACPGHLRGSRAGTAGRGGGARAGG